jgi:hypothetical protein
MERLLIAGLLIVGRDTADKPASAEGAFAAKGAQR